MIFVYLVGLVELVMESETLRKIQVRGHGLAGSFKDRTIVEWLQVHNPTELDYRKVYNNQRYTQQISPCHFVDIRLPWH